jgi:hypothetical protein
MVMHCLPRGRRPTLPNEFNVVAKRDASLGSSGVYNEGYALGCPISST